MTKIACRTNSNLKILRLQKFSKEIPDTFYHRWFRAVFPKATIVSAGIDDIREGKQELIDKSYRNRPASKNPIEIEKRAAEVEEVLCDRTAEKLCPKIAKLRSVGQPIIFEEDCHEAALPFYVALNRVFKKEFVVLSLDDHLDAEANEFEYNSFWKFGINNHFIKPQNLIIYGSSYAIWAREFLSYFDYKDEKEFISALLSLMPTFERRVLHVFDPERYRIINEFTERNLSKKITRDKLIEIHASIMAFSDSYGSRLRSFWETHGLIGKGVMVLPPPGKNRQNKGNPVEFKKMLKEIKQKVAGQNLLVSLDIDINLHPDRLFELAVGIKKAEPNELAINIAGLDSRNKYPVGVEDEEIAHFVNLLTSA